MEKQQDNMGHLNDKAVKNENQPQDPSTSSEPTLNMNSGSENVNPNKMKENDVGQEQLNPPTSGIPDKISGNKFFVLLTGNTLNVHEEIIDYLKKQRPNLQEVKTVDECDFILVFCPIVSRAGTDIEAAEKKLREKSDTKPAVLVVLHHTFDRDCVVSDSIRTVKRKNSLTVDCLFHEDQGLLQCHKNTESLTRITNIIKPQESSASSSSWWGWLWSSKDEGNEAKKPEEERKKEHSGVPELRLVVLGRKHSGKSLAKNIILGREERNQAAASTAIYTSTQQSVSTVGEIAGKKLVVVDTPDWFSPEISLENLRQDVKLCMDLSAPGPHVFLLVIHVKHSEDKEVHTVMELKATLLKIEEIFGERCCRNTIILFTVIDEHQKKTAEKLIKSKDQELQTLLEKYEKRFHFLNLKETGDNFQVPKLLQNVIVKSSSEKFYSSEIYLKTLQCIGEIEKKIRETVEKLDDPANELMRRMKEQKDDGTNRKLEEEQAEKIEQSTEKEQNVKELNENSEMAIRELHKEEVYVESEINEVKTNLHEIWRSVLISSMKMQKKFCRQMEEIEKKNMMIKELEQQLEERDRKLKEIPSDF